MTDLRTAAQMALDALEFDSYYGSGKKEAIEALRARLAQGEQENMNEPRQGWHLREVWFEDGEPTMHREPSQPS